MGTEDVRRNNLEDKRQTAFPGKCFLKQDFEKEKSRRPRDGNGKEKKGVLELLGKMKKTINDLGI